MKHTLGKLTAAIAIGLFTGGVAAQSAPAPAAPAGEVKGAAWRHTDTSRAAVIANANLALPASGDKPAFFGKWKDASFPSRKLPIVVFMHGSSGLGLKAIEDWQRWLAGIGVASVAPDSFVLEDRINYKSPVSKEVYERIHSLRMEEIVASLAAVRAAAWVDSARVVLAGTSEGAVAVARTNDPGLAGRILFSWSCEDNYFVAAHRTAVIPEQPILNVMSSTDVFFSASNTWLGNASPLGHCGNVLAAAKRASVVLIPGAPHTLMNLSPARAAAEGFVREVLRP